jgi:fructose-1-phosphate kinase PfkB-like protein
MDIVKLHHGKTHRAETMQFQVGGKGVNVTRILEHLGIPSEAIGFAGGPLAELCNDWMTTHNLRFKFFPLESGVRPGMVIREAGDPDNTETTILGLDLVIPTSAWVTAIKRVAFNKPPWLAICGSIPGWQKTWINPLEELLESGNVQICADTYGPPLEDLILLPLELIKINRTELERLFPEMAGASIIDLLAEVSSVSKVRNWIITDGRHPILAAFENGDLYEATPASVKEVSATGSGDTFLAALLQQSIAGADPVTMLGYAAACASANAASSGIGDFKLPLEERFLPRITRL